MTLNLSWQQHSRNPQSPPTVRDVQTWLNRKGKRGGDCIPRPLLAFTIALGVVAWTSELTVAATRYVVVGTDRNHISVRNQPGDFVIGHLYASSTAGPNVSGAEHIDIVRVSGAWGYGRAYGKHGNWNGTSCGWVLMEGVRSTGQQTSATCPEPSNAYLSPEALFQPGSYVTGCGSGCVQPAVVVECAYPYAYGNYDPSTGSFSNRYGNLPVGRGTPGYLGVTSGYSGFGTRYTTKDGKATLIKDSQSPAGNDVPTWFFMRTECLSGQLVSANEKRSWLSSNTLLQRLISIFWRMPTQLEQPSTGIVDKGVEQYFSDKH